MACISAPAASHAPARRWSGACGVVAAQHAGEARELALVVHVGRNEQVNLFVGQIAQAQLPAGRTAKSQRSLTPRRDQHLCGLTHVVLRMGIRHGIGQGFIVRRGDVRHPMGGPHDGGRLCRRRVRGAGW